MRQSIWDGAPQGKGNISLLGASRSDRLEMHLLPGGNRRDAEGEFQDCGATIVD